MNPTPAQQARIDKLKEDIAELKVQLQYAIVMAEADTSGLDPEQIVQRHIRLLHTYNEIKDGAQSLIGKVRTEG